MSARALADYSAAELADFHSEAKKAYDELLAGGLSLNLTRGKPSSEQLDLSNDMLQLPRGYLAADGTDTRNYGGLAGLPDIRSIFGELLGVPTAQIIAGGNSSLAIMREILGFLLQFGAVDSPAPWKDAGQIKFICPVPGYDRHFTLLESLGIEMITVPTDDDGPDPAAVAALVKDDPSVKGMWIVPTYANPSGATCSQEVAAALAAMPTAAPDFKIFWDNAYALHHLTAEETKSADMITLCEVSGNPHRTILFASTSKITFAGSGVAFMASSQPQVEWYLTQLAKGYIGPDKVNHLRHAQFFGDAAGVRAHMVKHRDIIAPKFAELDRILTEQLSGLGIASWTKPTGGYFVSLDVMDGTAARVVALAKDAGIALTGAGSSFPYRQDPNDRNIRLAPTLPPLAEVTAAMMGVTVCVKLAASEKLLDDAV